MRGYKKHYWLAFFMILLVILGVFKVSINNIKIKEVTMNYLISDYAKSESSFKANFLDGLLGYDATSILETLSANTSMVALSSKVVNEDLYKEDTQANVWHFEKKLFGDTKLSDDVQVIIYHTHNAESYKPTYGVSKQEGENAGVYKAGVVLTQALEDKYGIRVWHSDVLHDYPDWSKSYNNSYKTITALLKENDKAKVVFDIHRDAGYSKKETSTVNINGKNAAQILLVIGANHENYKENLAFAQALEDKANELYPNLIRKIRISEKSRYNQQVHPHSVIVEVGSDLNTQEEADYSMECFAHVCKEVMDKM